MKQTVGLNQFFGEVEKKPFKARKYPSIISRWSDRIEIEIEIRKKGE